MDAMKYYESANRIVGKSIDMNEKKAANLGVFLNMEDYRYVADFYDALHQATAEAIIFFAKVLKERYQGKNRGSLLRFLWLYGFLQQHDSYGYSADSGLWSCGFPGGSGRLQQPGPRRQRGSA